MASVLNKDKTDFELTELFGKLGELVYRMVKQGKMLPDDKLLKHVKIIDKFVEHNVE